MKLLNRTQLKSLRTLNIKALEEIIKKVNTVKEVELDKYISESGFYNYITIDSFIKNEPFIVITDLDIAFNDDGEFIFSRSWLSGATPGTNQINLIFQRCSFVNPKGETSLLIDNNGMNEFYETIQFIDCKLSLINLELNGAKNIIVKRSRLLSLKVRRQNTSLQITDSKIDELKVGTTLKTLEIINSKLESFDTDNILIENELINFYFDEKSTISGKENESTFRKLQAILKKNTLYNKIQHHILYTKELQSYTKNNSSSDDKILFKINKALNNHGRSILLPVFWLFTVNLFFIFWFNFSNSDFYSNPNFSWLSFTWEGLIRSLDVSPLSNYPDNLNKTLRSLDGFRKIILAVISYGIISSAVRFKFKN